MKLNKFLLTGLACTMLMMSFVSCSDDDDNEKKPEPEPTLTEAAYILNSGIMDNNNTSLTMYDYTSGKTYYNIFEDKNNLKMGDTGQDLLVYGQKMYVSVYNSATILVLNKNYELLTSIQSMRDGQPQQPRYLTAHNGKVYVTLFDGYLACIDTVSLSIEKQVKVGPNPEQVKVANNKLYVANSGGMNYPTYNNTVSVVDINSFTVSNTIEVAINPTRIQVDNQGDVYVISTGNYGDIKNTLQRIDPQTNKAEVIGNATIFTSTGDKLYTIYAQYEKNPDPSKYKYTVYDAINEKVITEKFITDGTLLKNPTTINVQPSTGNIYIGDTPAYTGNGDMYVFSPEGKLLNKFDTGGPNPTGTYFMKK